MQNGIILPPRKTSYPPNVDVLGGVLDSDGNYVDISCQPAVLLPGDVFRVRGSYDFSEDEVVHSDERVIYMNCALNFHWGHTLIDVLGRVWYMSVDKDTKVAYTYNTYVVHEDKLRSGLGNILELMELAGISRDRFVRVDKVTRFREVIVPELSVFPGKYFTREWRELFDRIIENSGARITSEKKIYCSRSRLPDHKEDGESYIEKVFTDNGYVPVYMERMTVREQIQALNSASEIAMVNGTLAHNLLLVAGSPKVTIINKTYAMNFFQPLVNQASHASEIYYVDAYVSPLPVSFGAGPFIMRLTPEFMRYCKDKGMRLEDGLVREGTQKLNVRTRVLYYLRWLRKYIVRPRYFVVSFVKGMWAKVKLSYREAGIPEYYKKVRAYYRSQQRGG
ncbi:MAG: glycosyltransferase family 61 protein [Synergistaceae bacterium]|nr:glycosyltransferase family 61 protein [Synergistaceae bacterium]